MPTRELHLLTVICQRKDEKKIIEAAVKTGVPGVTALHGHGTGVRQRLGLAGQLVEADKSILMLAVPPELSPAVVKALNEAGSLNKPGSGFILLQKTEQVLGYL